MKKKILINNVFFAPKSFGGATIVAEELAKLLSKDFDIYVVTTIKREHMPEYYLLRYNIGNINVIGVNILTENRDLDFENIKFKNIYHDILDVIEPDLIHTHCIQTMGATFFDAIKERGIKHIVTIHDNWWICERQFMINQYDKYCWQSKIDITKCNECMNLLNDRVGFYNKSVKYRLDYLLDKLKKADTLLFPSVFQKNLYLDNIEHINIRVNKNGVKTPLNDFKKNSGDKITFGFVGGVGPIKGLDVIINAFKEISRTDYKLIIVDNTLNLDYSSINIGNYEIDGEIQIVPAYSQENMDEFFGKLDVLLFPSQWKESFGLTVREAMLRDVWIIATNSGGVVEDIVEGENGNIIPITSDSFFLKEAILKTFDIDLKSYKTPHKNKITTYKKQSEELKSIIKELLWKTNRNIK